jgi:hypothetical protein
MEATDYIPTENFNLWYSLFKQSTGRFLCNPINYGTKVFVRYSFDDMDSYNNLELSYQRLTTPIKETRRGFWKTLKARLGL